MIYDSKKHAICENWGTTIATFQKEVLGKAAFEIVDKINNSPRITQLEKDLDRAKEEIAHLENEVSDLKYYQDENYNLSNIIDERDQTIILLDEKVDKLEIQLKDIEEYGTEEINAAVELRQELAQLRVKYSELEEENSRYEELVGELSREC